MEPLFSDHATPPAMPGQPPLNWSRRSFIGQTASDKAGISHPEPGLFNRLFIHLFVCLLAGALVPLVFYMAFTYKNMASSQKLSFEKVLVNALYQAKTEIESLLLKQKGTLDHISEHLEKPPGVSPGMDTPWDDIVEHDAMASGLQEIIIVNASGTVVFSWPDKAYLRTNTLSGTHMNIPWLNLTVKCLETHQAEWTPPQFQAMENEPVAYTSRPVLDRNGKFLGVITGGLRKRSLAAPLENVSKRFTDASFYLFSNAPKAIISISSPGTEDTDQRPTPITHPNSSNVWDELVKTDRDAKGIPYSFLETPLDNRIMRNNPWTLLVQASLKPILAARHVFLMTALAYISGTLLLVVILALFISRGTTRAVSRYRIWADNTVQGRMVELKRPHGSHEIAQLGKSLSEISGRMKAMVRFCSAGAVGDFTQSFPARGDQDFLANSLNGIRDYFKIVIDAVGQIADGRYSLTLPRRSSHDELSPKLTNMARALTTMNEDNMRQIASTLAQMELIRYVSGDKDLNAMSDQLLSFLCQYLKAQIGVFYLFDRERQYFVKTATFGVLKTDYPDQIGPGERLCGQAIVEKNHLLAVSRDTDSPDISFSFQTEKPKSILAFPFILREEVVGVMELGTLGEFNNEHLDFLKKNNESIAIGIHSAQHRELTEKLLAKTIEQSESLKDQQEQLSLAYKELADQTEALKKSESQLIASETELKKANTELEAHSKRLEDQKRFLDQQNRELEETKTVLELKADELSRSNRYKSEFLANMSHELRTPLNSIILLSKLMSEHLEKMDETKHAKFALIINTSGKDLMNLIEEVLDLTKVTSGDMPVNLVRYNLSEMEKTLKTWYLKQTMFTQIEFSITLSDELPDHILTDSLKLERILKALLSNAFKYTEEGSVTVEIKRPDKNIKLPVEGLPHEKTVEFTVRDTGQGIPEDMQDLIFDAFRQVDGSITRKHGGTGLGLSLAQEFSRLLKGEIVLINSDETGSVFSLFLPETPMGRT